MIDESKHLSELLDGGTTLMVGSPTRNGLEFRPMTVAGIDGGIQILLDTNEAWVRDLDRDEKLQVTLSDDRNNNWAWMTGSFSMSTDDELIDQLWNPFADAYFDRGRDTPGIAVMTIVVHRGRYWSAPSGRIGSLISAVKAKFGDAEQSGEHGNIDPRP
jgi:general stress protein 26